MIKYYNSVVLYNKFIDSGVGLITGWKTPSLVEKILDDKAKKKVVSIGPLYTKNGINFVIANLFLNPHISHLVFLEDSNVDNSMNDAIKVFLSLLDKEEINFQEKFAFSKEDIHEFCSYFKKHHSVVPRKLLNEELKKITVPSNWRENVKEIEKLEIEQKDILTSEKMGFMIRANTVAESWERSIRLIGKYGNKKLSDYDEKQLELINLSIVILSEDLHNPTMVGKLGITKEEIESYATGLLSKEKPDGVKYTYGSRFRNYQGVDQLEYLTKILQDKEYTRRAVSTLWDPTIDSLTDEVPCIDLYQAVVQDQKLYMTAYLRANDIYNGFPRNIYGVLKIQEELCQRLQLKKGYVQVIAGSAHIYERNFGDIIPFLEEKKLFCNEDERGYFVIENQEDTIDVSLCNKEGVLEKKLQGKTANSLREACCELISEMDHAYYMGQELTKAEIALKTGIPYIQDRELPHQKTLVKSIKKR